MIRILTLVTLIAANIQTGEYVHPSTSDPDFVGESKYYMFYNHFWLNLHHFAYNKAIELEHQTLEDVLGQSVWDRMDPDERMVTRHALTFYRDSLIEKDLRRDTTLFRFKRWIVQYSIHDELPAGYASKSHVVNLNEFGPVYEKCFWITHKNQNQKVFKDHIEIIRQIESRAVARLEQLCQSTWQKEKIRVDICYHSKRDIPYTTTRPTTHIVMDAHNTINPRGGWIELLLHESSHHLIASSAGNVQKAIAQAAEETGMKPPWQLWHRVLFYVSGKAAQKLLQGTGIPDYEIYMSRKNVFTERFDLLEKYLQPYMQGKISLKDAMTGIIENFSK